MLCNLCAIVRACRFQVLTAASSIALAGAPGCINVNLPTKDAPKSLAVPEIRKAYEAKEAIESETAEVNRLGQELDGIVTQVSYQAPKVTGEAPKNQLIGTVRGLRTAADALLEKGPRYVEAIDRLAKGVRTGTRSFAGAAELFETFAADEPYEAIADDYRNIAKLFTELASRCANAQQDMTTKYDREALLETLRFVSRQRLLLDRLDAALVATFDDPDALELERYLAELDSYTRNYEAFRVQIRDLNRVIPLLQPTPNESKVQSSKPASAEPTTSGSGDAQQDITVIGTPASLRDGAVASIATPAAVLACQSGSARSNSPPNVLCSAPVATVDTGSVDHARSIVFESRTNRPHTRSLAK